MKNLPNKIYLQVVGDNEITPEDDYGKIDCKLISWADHKIYESDIPYILESKQSISIEEIRNKLSPVTNLIAMIEDLKLYPDSSQQERELFIKELARVKFNISLLIK